MRILVVAAGARARRLARELPWPLAEEGPRDAVAGAWGRVDALVCVMPAPAALRLVAPHLEDKRTDPAVVALDTSGRFAVPLVGAHSGANELAEELGRRLGATPVVTTSADAEEGWAGLDRIRATTAAGDLATVGAALLEGAPVRLAQDRPWPLPDWLLRRTHASPGQSGEATLRVSDQAVSPGPGEAVLHPHCLVLGVGATSDAVGGLADAVAEVLADAGLSPAALEGVATLDRRCDRPDLAELGLCVDGFSAQELARIEVPNPSAAVAGWVGTPSVAEAAALASAGADAELVVPKRVFGRWTIALARRRVPRGHLSVVGLGPGDPGLRAPAAEGALRRADAVVGYDAYLDAAADVLRPDQERFGSPIGRETDRAALAVELAATGRRVAIVSSGDPEVYGMASLVVEELEARAATDPYLRARLRFEVVPGITAALAAGSALGAPLGHDFAALSLSDLLTPWPVIERRLRALALSDFVVALYNPRSAGRPDQLRRALGLLAESRPASTPVALADEIGTQGQRIVRSTLGELLGGEARALEDVGMRTTVLVGSSTTRVVGPWLVTPRGYRRDAAATAAPANAQGARQSGPAPARPRERSRLLVSVDDRCTACGACVVTCPEGALRPAPDLPVLRPARCTGCLACVEVCPTGAISPIEVGQPRHPIEAESYRQLRRSVPAPAPGASPAFVAVVERVHHATADPDLAGTLRERPGAAEDGVRLLVEGAPVVADVEMVRQGLRLPSPRCYLDLARRRGTDRWPTASAAAIALAVERHPEGACFVIGCAPSALAELCGLIEAGACRPGLVVGTPVGYVGAVEAKERLAASETPAIWNEGRRGGAAVAAAVANALWGLAVERLPDALGRAQVLAGDGGR